MREGVRSRGRWDGTTEAGQERAGLWSVFFLLPRCLLAPLLPCPFLVSDLLLISSMYISLPCHTIPLLLLSSTLESSAFTTIHLFSVFRFYFRSFFHSFLSAPHVDDEAPL